MAIQLKDPSRAVITSVGGALNGGTADSTTPVIKGTADAGDIVDVYDGVRWLGSAVVAADGTWSFTPATPIKAGTHSFAAIAHDSDGNYGDSSVPMSVQINAGIVPPAAPSVDSVTDNVGPITGPVPKNGTTDDNDPTIAGKGVAGDVVHVKDNGTEIGSATVDANGNWSFKPVTPLADGSHDITATQTDPKTGATSPASADWPFKVDTTAPVAPVIVSVNDAVGPITGPVPKNGTTDDNDPTIKGTGVAGDVVHVMDNGKEIGTATVDASGNWSLKPATPLADGAHDITATQANPATGKLSPASADWPFTVFTGAQPPVITDVADAVGPVQGTVPNNGTTDDNHPTISGTGTAGDTIYIYQNGVGCGDTKVDATGHWSLKIPGAMSDGKHDMTATQFASGQAQSGPSNTWTINIDTTAPVAPVIVSVNDAVGPITGPVPKNGTTDDNDPTIKGTGVAGDVVHVMDNGKEIGTATVDASGNWSLKPATPLANGAHDITATQANPATGKLSPVSADWPFTVAAAPAAPSVDSVTDAVGPITGPVPKNGTTDDNDPTIAGKGVAGDVVHVKDNGTEIGSATVDANGNWSFKPVTPLADGSHDITATQTDPKTGATSPASADWPFKVDTTAPVAPVVVSVNDAVGSITGPVPKNGVTDDNDPTIKGTGVAGDVVHVMDNGKEIGTAKVDASGNWSFKPATVLADGDHDITATQANPATGKLSPVSNDWPFTVDTYVPPAPSVTSVTDAVGPITGPVAKNGTTDDNDPTIAGKGISGSTVHVMDNGKEIGTATVDALGNWSLKPATPLADGSHDITAMQTDAVTGANSPTSTDWPFKVDTTAPAPVIVSVNDAVGPITGPVPKNGTTDDNDPTIKGTGVAGDVVHIKDNGTEIGTATVDASGNWSFKPATPLADGAHDMTATQTNAATGKVSPASGDWPFTVATTPPPAETVSITGMVDNALGTHLALANGGTTFDKNPTVNGSVSTALQTGETLVVYRDGVKVGTATVNGKSWSFQDSNVPVGNHTYTADVVNGTSHGTVSNSYSFTEISTVGEIMAFNDALGQACYAINVGNAFSSGKVDGLVIQATSGPAYITLGPANSGVEVSPGIWTVVVYAKGWYSGIQYDRLTPPSISYYKIDSSNQVTSVPLDSGNVTKFGANVGVWYNFDAGTLPTGVSAVHLDTTVATDDTATTHGLLGAAAAADPAATPATDAQAQYTAVGDHQSFTGTSGHDTVDLNMDPTAYFKESTAHIQGSTAHPVEAAGAAPAVNTLHLTGDHQILDLTSLTGKTAAAKISGIEVIDLGGHSNSLKLSLSDVLNLGEQDLFQKDGHQQMMVNGSNGDTVDLSNAHIAGVADGQWQQAGTAQVGGVTYNVYEHSGAHTELLVQQGVQIALHN